MLNFFVRLTMLAAMSAPLAACVSENAGDLVHDSAAAIEAAKKLCDWKPAGDSERWHAQLRQGTWHVWLNVHYERSEGAAIRFVLIRASDGKSDGCPYIT
jgi:hypothetical protein